MDFSFADAVWSDYFSWLMTFILKKLGTYHESYGCFEPLKIGISLSFYDVCAQNHNQKVLMYYEKWYSKPWKIDVICCTKLWNEWGEISQKHYRYLYNLSISMF